MKGLFRFIWEVLELFRIHFERHAVHAPPSSTFHLYICSIDMTVIEGGQTSHTADSAAELSTQPAALPAALLQIFCSSSSSSTKHEFITFRTALALPASLPSLLPARLPSG